MRRIARTQQRKRQTWLALPASGIEEVGHGADIRQTQDTDHQRGLSDRHHEDGLDGRLRTDRSLELSALRNYDMRKRET